MLIVLALACGEPSDVRVPGPATGTPENTESPVPPSETEPGSSLPTALEGFIGSPCAVDDDCHPGGVCFRDDEGFPLGMCSEPCSESCPDAPEFPTTFCATVDRMPAAAASLGDGACTSRCDFTAYPERGCREDYGCAVADRAGEEGVSGYVCLPGLDSELTTCLADLVARGIGFETGVVPDAAPADDPELTCHVEAPVKVHSPLFGVEIRYEGAVEAVPVTMSCDGAHALADTVEDLLPEDATILWHYGTYVCRTIAGTDTLSRHAYGDAIDFAAFSFADGTRYSVYDHWEDGDDTPETPEGAWLYETVHRWDKDDVWNILLTPEFNAAHDNHFHVDLTPDSDFLGARGAFVPPGPPGPPGPPVERVEPQASQAY
ncbi:MAG: extensin family protein [Deltaproteobacteria bacterium]|nr:extensin family protein [Deltaproteobacteria bacterium]